jgi:TPR repeat protein
LEYGKGVPKDMAQAIRLYRLAAEKEYIPAIGYLGWLMFQGNGLPKDVENVLKVMAAAAMDGDMPSVLRLAAVIEAQGKTNDAFQLYKRAASEGHAGGVFKYARCMENGIGCSRDPSAAAVHYERLVNQADHEEAMVRLAVLRINGTGVRKDVETGVKLLQRAASLGNAEAKQILKQLGR